MDSQSHLSYQQIIMTNFLKSAGGKTSIALIQDQNGLVIKPNLANAENRILLTQLQCEQILANLNTFKALSIPSEAGPDHDLNVKVPFNEEKFSHSFSVSFFLFFAHV